MCGCGSVNSEGNNTAFTASKTERKPCTKAIYSDLIFLNSRIIEMYKAGYKKSDMLESNSLLSKWIANINKSCPPQDEFAIIRDFVTDEYSKFNP